MTNWGNEDCKDEELERSGGINGRMEEINEIQFERAFIIYIQRHPTHRALLSQIKTPNCITINLTVSNYYYV